MKTFAVGAASYIDPESWGSDSMGLRPWPAALDRAHPGGWWESLRWSDFFGSECPRFGRADPLCKLTLIATELLAGRLAGLSDEEKSGVAVCLGTGLGSIATDCSFLQTRSPSVFTYTLPSTAIGEICIRHKLRGPVRCFMTAKDGCNAVMQEAIDLLDNGEAGSCLCIQCDAIGVTVPAGLSECVGGASGYAAAVFLEGKAPHLKNDTGRYLDLRAVADLRTLCRDLCSASVLG
ncbi:MAG: beta-ketoacyl synthase N-terminal-like domain-containing protein [bacterium]